VQVGGEKNPLVICMQETKLQHCDDVLGLSLWGSSPHAFSFRPSVGSSGGVLTECDSTEIEVWSSVSRDHAMWCHGQFKESNEEFYMANVYTPCDPRAKQVLWDSLSARLHSLVG
jgi:hypothetical protein